MLVENVLVTVVLGLAFLVGGGVVMKHAFDERAIRQLMAETPTSQVESLAVGPAEVKGVVTPAGDPMPAPFTEEDCLVAIWTIEEYRTHTDSKGRRHSSWTTIASGTDQVPFYLDDGTGRVLVRPDDRVDYDVGDREQIRRGRGQRPPSNVHAFKRYKGDHENGRFLGLDLWDSVDAGSTWRKRRFTQRLIRPGERVYVFGTVQLRDGVHSADNPENLVIERVERGDEDLEPMFLVSNRSEAALRKSRRFSLLLFPVGALVSTVGLGILLAAFGLF